MEEYKYYIAGEFKKSANELKIVNPATEEIFAKIFETPKQDLDSAIEKAGVAQQIWRQISFKERAKLLRQIAKVILDNLSCLTELETKEIGKPLKESLFVDVPLAAECFNYYASFLESFEQQLTECDFGIDLIKYQPFGVCGVYLPFNVPLMIFGFSCAGALAAGNALIVKPSEYGSLSVLRLARVLDKLDMPKGLISIITGRGETTGRFLAESKVDIISFTGSRKTLKQILVQSADNPRKIICELGGCNLTLVFSDADKQQALQNILGSSFMKQGQMCIGTSMVLVQDSIFEDFTRDLTNMASRIKVADPFSPDSGMGALPTRDHLQSIHRRVKELESKGARILCGGSPLNTRGYFYPPTIIEVDEAIYEEFFAPVILIKKFEHKQQVLEIMQKNPTGLVLQIWSKDLDRANDLANRAACGTVWINTFAQMGPHTPFGGVKESGWGRNLGKSGFFEYTQPKHIGIGLKKSPVWGWFGI